MTYIGVALHSFQSLFTYVYYPVWSMHQARQPLLWVWPVLPSLHLRDEELSVQVSCPLPASW